MEREDFFWKNAPIQEIKLTQIPNLIKAYKNKYQLLLN
jgi:hypothetical protein